MSEWPGVHSGRTETFPPAIFSSLRFRHRGDPARVRRSEPLNPSREKCRPNLHGPPPQAARAAWVGFGHLSRQHVGCADAHSYSLGVWGSTPDQKGASVTKFKVKKLGFRNSGLGFVQGPFIRFRLGLRV